MKKLYFYLSRIPSKKSSKYYVKYLRENGISVGNGTFFVSPRKTWVDDTKKGFITIGDKCVITAGVIILAHDWSYSIMTNLYDDIVGKQMTTKIGNNVFIGTNSILLMGADIGDNVIIGAGAVVSGKVESNSVYAGNPAKRICSIEEQYNKYKSKYIPGAKAFINEFQMKHGRLPQIEELDVYRPLFVDKTQENMDKYFSHTNADTRETIKKMPQVFDTVEDCIKQ